MKRNAWTCLATLPFMLVGTIRAADIGTAFTDQSEGRSGGDDRASAVDAGEWPGLAESGRGLEQRAAAPAYAGVSPRGPSDGWDRLTESGGGFEDERELEQIIPWAPDQDTETMGGLRGDGDIAVYDNAPCGGNGIVDLDDIFGVLDAFAGIIPCNCPAAGGGWTLTGNGGTNEATDFLGTTDNVALNVRVNDLRAFRLEPNATSPNVIGGFSGNSVTAGAIGATIAGGGRFDDGFGSPDTNHVTDDFGTVGGGSGNIASAGWCTVGGGARNTASGYLSTVGGGVINDATGSVCTVGGGERNAASGAWSTVGGGLQNTANSFGTVGGGYGNDASVDSTVSGGQYNAASSSWSTVGGGIGNTARGIASTAGGGDGNDAIAGHSTVGGGSDNTASGYQSTVGGGHGNAASGHHSTVGGGGNIFSGNTASGDSATVAGGLANRASGYYSTVGGGTSNTAAEIYSTVGGGGANTASGGFSTVGGGTGNRASGRTSTVGGGDANEASGSLGATVSGGLSNIASGISSTVPGGQLNQTGGDFSFAAGRRAKVRDVFASGVDGGDEGTFVWADSTDADFVSTGPNQFLIRASGGVGVNRNNPGHPLHVGTDTTNGNGAHVTAGGVWTSTSDRNTKQNFERLDSEAVLQAVADLPMSKWQYIGEPDDVRHIGPMAQDFYSAFGLGQSDKHIGMIDADGVALAAIQGLHGILQEKDCQIAELRERNEDMADRYEQLEARLAMLEAAVSELLMQRKGE